jgi:hypothetical protein
MLQIPLILQDQRPPFRAQTSERSVGPLSRRALTVATLFIQSFGRGRLALLGAVIGFTSFAGCGETTATGTSGPPATVVATAGANQVALQGTAVAQAPTVKVTDVNSNPVVGAIVTFAVILGGGSANGLNQITDALGLASVASWTLGSEAPNTLSATVTGSGIAGNPVTFTAQSATQITMASAPAGPITLATNFTISVLLMNSVDAPVALPGSPLTIAIASGGGTLNGTLTRTTDANGTVSFTLINVTGAAGARTFIITGAGLGFAMTFPITFN